MNRLLASAALVGALLGSAAAGEPWSLERAIRHSLTNSPEARIAAKRILAAQAALGEANAAFWPRLQFQSSYTRTDNPMLVFGSILNQQAYPGPSLDFNDVPDMDDLNVRGVLTMPLYTGGRNRSLREAAKAGAAASKADAAAVANALGFEVARAYYSTWKAHEFIRAAEGAVNAFESNVAIAEKRHRAGSLLKTDLLDIQVRLAQTREDLVRARNAHALSLRALRNLLGVEEAEFGIVDTPPPTLAPPGATTAERAELAAAAERERAAREQVRGARAGYQPRLSAFGSLDYDHGWRSDNGAGSYTAGALLQWDIWDGQLTRSKVRQAEAQLAATEEQSRKLRLDLDLELERARLDLLAAQETLSVTERSVEQAAESASLTRARFEQGEALSTQLMDAEIALLNARVRRAQAESDRNIAVAALRAALGLPQLQP